MKAQKLLKPVAIIGVIGFLGLVGVVAVDYFYRVNHWKSREGFREITGLDLPASVEIRGYKVSSFFSIADRPNHRWLLESKGGFESLKLRTVDFMLGGAEFIKVFHDDWPELDDQYGSKEVGEVIMGIGTGQETIFISSDGKFAIVYAFRT